MKRVTKKTVLLTAALLLAVSATASAQPWRGWGRVAPRAYIYAPFYDPFWGYYPYAGYPYVVERPHAFGPVAVIGNCLEAGREF